MTRREEIARAAYLCGFHPADAEIARGFFEDDQYPDLKRRSYSIADAILSLPPEEPVTSELVAKLKEASETLGIGAGGLYDQAASALTLQEAEIARLKKEMSDGEFMKVGTVDALISRAETAEQARDEALKALEALRGRKFPIMRGPSIPWFIIAPWNAQAKANHGQDLERLAERGGLSPCEAVAVLMGRKWERIEPDRALATLQKIVEVRSRLVKGS